MKADFRVFLDACVLANFGVCDLLLRLSERPRLIVPHWSAEVMAETRRTQVEKLGCKPELADSFEAQIRVAFPDAEVVGYEGLLGLLSNDLEDRHVLAAAIRGNCPLILTFNLKHFPAESLQPWSICASHPQDYLLILYEMERQQVTAVLGEIAGKRKIEVEDVLIRLGKSLPAFAQRLLDDLG
ncbi:MAG: PIN domain-containing protein [Terrimicrobiaceae bacterium]|nr:PIN domain-containing protein [Terrimicrobiaceae bacterium]